MNNKGFEHPVYKKYFGNLRNVRIVTQKTHDETTERVNVHYPLAREIAEGKLAQFNGYDSYIHENVFVLNNLRVNAAQDEGKEIRTWKKKNPDITVLSSQGQITVIECKNEAKFNSDDIDRMAKTLITLLDIAGPYTLSNKTTKDSWSKLSFLYKSCYEIESRYPTLQESLNELFSLRDFAAKQRWSQLVTEYIKSSKFQYIVAFAGEAKREAIQSMMRNLEMKINEYEPALTDVTKIISFISLQCGKIHDFRPSTDYL